MKATDFRIGNLYEYFIQDEMDPRKEWWEVCEMDIDSLRWLVHYPEDKDYRHIPLTEEWLLNLGFYETKENAGTLICYNIKDFTTARWINGKWQFWIDSKDIKNSPQYVHQLQNLYHALTGEELLTLNL